MSTTDANLRSTPFELQVRKLTRFDFSQLENALHTDDNQYISHFFNALSLVTPITEGILIRAIRESQPLLAGSGLEQDALAFIGQEAVHTREHRAFNHRLGELGFDTDAVVRQIEIRIKAMEAAMTLQERLALVVTGEHVIYSMARALLTAGYKHCNQQEEIKRLFVWHSLEEMEHQSVCDDIYKHLYGTGLKHKLLHYRIFLIASKLLSQMTAKLMQSLLAQSRKSRASERREFVSWLLFGPGFGIVAAREMLGFFSPGFKHWERSEEDQQLICRNLALVYEQDARSAQ